MTAKPDISDVAFGIFKGIPTSFNWIAISWIRSNVVATDCALDWMITFVSKPYAKNRRAKSIFRWNATTSSLILKRMNLTDCPGSKATTLWNGREPNVIARCFFKDPILHTGGTVVAESKIKSWHFERARFRASVLEKSPIWALNSVTMRTVGNWICSLARIQVACRLEHERKRIIYISCNQLLPNWLLV